MPYQEALVVPEDLAAAVAMVCQDAQIGMADDVVLVAPEEMGCQKVQGGPVELGAAACRVDWEELDDVAAAVDPVAMAPQA